MVRISGNEYIVFIIRIRPVPREIQGAEPVWRGEVEYLDASMNTSRKAFFKSLEEIILFIRPVLQEMGMETAGPSPGRRCLINSIRTFLSRL